MRSEPSPPRPERARWPRLGAAAHPRLRPLLPCGYAGYTEETTPRHIVLPATTSIGLVVKILDSPWRQRFALADRFLLRRLDRGPQPSPEVGWVWRRLVATGGAAPIGRLAREVGWSHKHLTARFKQQVGLPPKTVARLLRLDGVWRRMDVPRPLDWGQIAADAGTRTRRT
jgi:AraC-like DNA-binding protein